MVRLPKVWGKTILPTRHHDNETEIAKIRFIIELSSQDKSSLVDCLFYLTNLKK